MAKRGRPAIHPENRESQLTALAYDAAEQRLRDGTASAQEIVYFLKLGSSIAELEKEKLKNETAVLQAKAKTIQSVEETKALVEDAIRAMRNYSGNGDADDYDEYDD